MESRDRTDSLRGRRRQARQVGQGSGGAAIDFYSHLLADIQGAEPRRMHLALGTGEFASFSVKDYAAYERQALRLIELRRGRSAR